MSTERDDVSTLPGVRAYMLLCLVSLLVITVILVQYDIGYLALVPLLAGSVSSMAGWVIGPPVVIGTVVWLLVMTNITLRGLLVENFVVDWLLSIAVVAYTAGHFRLMSLKRHIFPPDPRRRLPRGRTLPGVPLPPVEQPRPPELPEVSEAGRLAAAVFLAAGLATLLFESVRNEEPALGFTRPEWTALVLVWVSSVVIISVALALAVARIYRQGPEEAMMYLQDQVWRQTRREQSRINRWLVWARLLWERRERRRSRAAGKETKS
jgi:hypothetical protein